MGLVPNNLDRIAYNLIAKSVEIVDRVLFNMFYSNSKETFYNSKETFKVDIYNSKETFEIDALVKKIKELKILIKNDLNKNVNKDINMLYSGIFKLENLLEFKLDNPILPGFERFWSTYDVDELFTRYNYFSKCSTKSAAKVLCFRPEWYEWVKNLSNKMEIDPAITISNIDLLMSESWLVEKRMMSAKFSQYKLADDLRFIKSYVNQSLQEGI